MAVVGRLTKWIAVLGVVLAVVATWQAGRWTERTEITALRDATARRLDVYTAYMQSRLDFFSVMPEIIAGSHEVRDLVEAGGEREVADANAYLEGFAAVGGVAVAYVMNAQGVTVAASNWRGTASFIGQNYAFRPYFLEAMQGRRGRMVAVGATSRQSGYYVSAPVMSRGQPVAVVVLKFDLDRLITAQTGGEKVLLVDDHEVVFLASQPEFLFRSLRPLAPEDIRRLGETRKYGGNSVLPLPLHSDRSLHGARLVAMEAAQLGLGESEDNQPVEYLFEERGLPGTDWKLVVMAETGHLRRSLVINQLAALLGVSLLMGAAFYADQRRSYLKSLVENAIRDPLTQLYTRLYMNEAVIKLLQSHDRGAVPGVALAMFDIDHFKRVNDTHGHAVGDAVLAQVAAVILEQARSTDIAVRFGGEELAVFLASASIDDAMTFAERLRATVERRMFVAGSTTLRVTLSGGVAMHRVSEALGDLVIRADERLYAAKRQGRNRVLAELAKEIA